MIRGSAFLTPFTMSMVDAFPLLVTSTRTPRVPFVRTIFVWGEKPSCTCATSFMYTGAPLTVLIGRLFRSFKANGLLLTLMEYSGSAGLAVPAGNLRFLRVNAFDTVSG